MFYNYVKKHLIYCGKVYIIMLEVLYKRFGDDACFTNCRLSIYSDF